MWKVPASSTMPVILLTMFKPNGLVVLTTDFGTSGSYVGAMRGAVLQAYHHARLVDLTHDIPPQDVYEAARILAAAVPFYPHGTTHLVVVDPGGWDTSKRSSGGGGGQAFVGPDNGVLVPVTTALGLTDAREIQHPDLRADQISHTFHGRDVFGPTAGALAGGFSVPDVGVQFSCSHCWGPYLSPLWGRR